MKIVLANVNTDMEKIKAVSKVAFSSTSDASLDEWLSFSYMKEMLEQRRGYCLLAIADNGQEAGVIYAQQENPINGREGEEKWVIIIAGVDPQFTGQGIGSMLLAELEKLAHEKNVTKIFTFTNKDDEEVINFYQKNGYKDAGWIKDYQYGSNNSAVFLLKHLN